MRLVIASDELPFLRIGAVVRVSPGAIAVYLRHTLSCDTQAKDWMRGINLLQEARNGIQMALHLRQELS